MRWLWWVTLVACAQEGPHEEATPVRAPVAPLPLPENAFEDGRDASAAPADTRFATRSIGGESAQPSKRWTGRRVTLDLKNTDVQEAFRLLADVGKVNIVVAGEVSGTITMLLKDVPWDQALHLVATTKNLSIERDGNVYLVRPH